MDINDFKTRNQIAETIEVEIDDYCEKSADRWRSRRLGSSAIGKPCSRQIWYGFRWVKEDEFGSENRPAGQVFRLFNRGHREEPVVVGLLQAIGCKLLSTDESQETYSDCHDHAVTKLDGVIHLPEKFGVTEKVLLEIKTASDTNFNKMQKKKVITAEPKYWDQMCFSAELGDFNYALFVVVNKNTDDIHVEFLKLDREHGRMLKDKAMAIITADVAPPKISNSSTNFDCKFCNFKDICHFEGKAEKNCRSCIHAGTATEGNWFCKLHGNVIPTDFIPLGCDHHEGVK